MSALCEFLITLSDTCIVFEPKTAFFDIPFYLKRAISNLFCFLVGNKYLPRQNLLSSNIKLPFLFSFSCFTFYKVLSVLTSHTVIFKGSGGGQIQMKCYFYLDKSFSALVFSTSEITIRHLAVG